MKTADTSTKPVLNWINVFAKNLEDLPEFYSELFDLTEIDSMRNSVFRGFDTGGSALGFLAPEVYDVLQLPPPAETGVTFLLNFEAGSAEEVEALVAKASAAGATIVKKPYHTPYGWYQAVLFDPEGNIFRINTILNYPIEGDS